jgi:CTP-dependent riboflavin kinase
MIKMSDRHKLSILSVINANGASGTPARFSFNSLAKTLNLTKQELDTFLGDLNKQRYISQYTKKGVDGFVVAITQKGLDAIMDQAFI